MRRSLASVLGLALLAALPACSQTGEDGLDDNAFIDGEESGGKFDTGYVTNLDAAEVEFPFRQSTLFHGLEQLPDLLTDPVGVREGYLKEFNAFRKELQTGCRLHHIDYVELRTDKDLGRSLAEYLVRRASR